MEISSTVYSMCCGCVVFNNNGLSLSRGGAVAKIIPYDRFLQKRIDKSAKRIHDQLIQQQRDRIDDLIGRLRSVVDKPKEE
jgi:hypothetical protein